MDDLHRRARRHAALGDPIRLTIVDELNVSDRAPGELATLFGIAPSLLAHHLDVLETAGIVERSPSTGDGRRRYVRLVAAEQAPVPAESSEPPASALFVCTRNSARSQLAAALWSELLGRRAGSAGTHPADRVHPGAVAAADRHGLDLHHARPTVLTPDHRAAVIITVCDRAHEELRADLVRWHWSLPDPVADGRPAAFDDTIDELTRRIQRIAQEAA